MQTAIKIKIEKIYKKIDKIAKSGRDYQMDYKKYLDELLTKGDYEYFQMCLEVYYDIDIRKYKSFIEVKNLTWNLIIEKTKSSFLERLKKLYRTKSVYQIGSEIRIESSLKTNIDLSNTLSSTYSEISGTSSKISLTKNGDILDINIIDDHLYNINISKVTWNNSNPIIDSLLQNINAGTYNDVIVHTGSTSNDLILDRLSIVNSINIPDNSVFGVTEIELEIDITHTYIGDLSINIKAPNERVMNVVRQAGGYSDNYSNIKFTTSDLYKRIEYIRQDNLTGKYQMDKYSNVGESLYWSDSVKLSDLLPTTNIGGTWSLYVKDSAGGDTGKLNSWLLNFSVIKKNDYFTQSSYPTQIPLTHGGTYLIEVEKKNDYGKFYYRLDISRDDLIGTITEVDIDNYSESNYYYRSKYLAEFLGYKKTFLEVRRRGSTEVITIAHNDPKVSEEMNLYQRYVMAIDYLLS